MTRLLTAVLGSTLAVLLALTSSLAVFANGPSSTCVTPTAAAAAASGTTTLPPGGWAAIGPWDAEQVANATTIIAVGTQLGVPPRGKVIALATAMQESGLRNLPDGDRDSLGLFQQRPSQGWSTPAQILDPAYAATRFYTALLAVPNWQNLPLTIAAQHVERSGVPGAYARHEAAATRLYTAIAGTDPTPAGLDTACLNANAPAVSTGLPAGFALPDGTPSQVVTAIGWALQQLGTPYSYGGNCTAPHSGDPARECDCSSLTRGAFAAAGVALPRTAADQSRVGVPVPIDQVRPGDLLFSVGADGTPTAPGHVMLSLGSGLAVEAPHTGAVVRLTTWSPAQVVTARRVAGRMLVTTETLGGG